MLALHRPRSGFFSSLFLVVSAFLFFLAAVVPLCAEQPYGFRFVRTDDDPTDVIYDQKHQRFYVAVPAMNQIYVVSAADGTVIAKVAVANASRLSLSPDSTKLYAGGREVEGLYIVDTQTLTVADYVNPIVPVRPDGMIVSNEVTRPYYIAAMKDGNVLELAGGFGSALFAHDLAANLLLPLQEIIQSPYLLKPSADGSRAVVLGNDTFTASVGIYDSGMRGYAASGHIYDSSGQLLKARDVVVNHDGTKFVFDGHLLYDDQFRKIADLNPEANLMYYRGAAFSPDGATIYTATNLTKTVVRQNYTATYTHFTIQAFDAANGTLLGYIPALESIDQNFGLAVSDGRLGVMLTDKGFVLFDVTTRVANLPTELDQILSIPHPVSPTSSAVSQATDVKIHGGGFRGGAAAWFGAAPPVSASLIGESELSAQAPPSSTGPGPVDVTVSFPDGWALFGPEGYSYGPVVLFHDVDAGPTSGGSEVNVVGYGLIVNGAPPRVTLGGADASVSNSVWSKTPNNMPLQQIKFTTPPGSEGWVDVVLTTSNGSYTLKKGFQYLTHRFVANVLPRNMVLDEVRNAVYVVDYVSGHLVSVDLSTLKVTTLFSDQSEPLTALAITPDRSRLFVVSDVGRTLKVIDLTTGAVVSSFVLSAYWPSAASGADVRPTSVIATSRGTAIIGMCVPYGLDSGVILEFDLQTGTYFSVKESAACRTLMAGSRDATKIFLATDTRVAGSGSALRIWDSERRALLSESVYSAGHAHSLSVSARGDRVLTNNIVRVSDATGVRFSQVAQPQFTPFMYSQATEFVGGWKIHPSGGLGYMPSTAGVEIYDMNSGLRSLSIGIPGGAASTVDGMVLDPTGQQIVLAEPTGLGIVTIAEMPLSIGSVVPNRCVGCSGQSAAVYGSGFLAGATVTIAGTTVSAQVVDSSLLTFVMPAVASQKLAITVQNPGGRSYTLPAAVDATAPELVTPTLSNVASSFEPLVGSSQVIHLTGTGFGADSRVFVNGRAVETMYSSETELGAYVYQMVGPNPLSFTVVNTATGATSNAINLELIERSPKILELWPNVVGAGIGDFLLHVRSNFRFSPRSVVYWNGTPRETGYANPSLIMAKIPSDDVAVAGSVNIYVSTPGTPEERSNVLTFRISETSPYLTASVNSQTFGPTVVGAVRVNTIKITSSGNVPVQISSITISDSTNFAQKNSCIRTLQPNESCYVDVSFSPAVSKKVGELSATLDIVSNASGAKSIPITGTAVDFALEAKSTTVSVKAGQSARFDLLLIGYGPIPYDVFLKCTELPPPAVWSVSPSSVVTPSPNGTPVTIWVSTTTQMAHAEKPRSEFGSLASLIAASTLLPGLLIVAGCRRRSGARTRLIWILCVALTSLAMNSCGGGGGPSSGTTPPPPPPQTSKTYKMKLVAEAGGASRPIELTFEVHN